MINKPVLCIHEVSEEMFDLPLEDYILTFDDGLYTQYQYIDKLLQLNTEKIYFISSNVICTGVQSTEYITCRDAHAKAFSGNNENYMTVEQIKELLTYPNVTVGGHSHSHKDWSDLRLVEKVNNMKADTELMLDWFWTALGIRPTKFCFPYNKNYDTLYNAALKQYGFKEFYGRERVSIESLLLTTLPN